MNLEKVHKKIKKVEKMKSYPHNLVTYPPSYPHFGGGKSVENIVVHKVIHIHNRFCG